VNQFPQKFLTNPSELRLYLCKISTVITETLIVLKPALNLIIILALLKVRALYGSKDLLNK
jgi:hypothetical protein